MSSIFISHSSNDNDLTERIHAWLKKFGHDDVFLDFHKDDGIQPADLWTGTLAESMKRAQLVLCLVSDNWFNSLWCQFEYSTAMLTKKEIIPLLIRPSPPDRLSKLKGQLRHQFGLVQHVDLAKNWDAGLSRLEKVLKDARATPWGFDVAPNSPPYKGLSAYTSEDAGLFFGRARETQETFEALRRLSAPASPQRLLIIRGASGAGKSSLLRAGLLPQVEARPKEWISVGPFIPEDSSIRDVTPLGSMAHALATKHASILRPVATAAILDALLKDPGAETARLLGLFRDASGAPNATLVLPVDQAEEMLRGSEKSLEQFLLALKAWLATPGCISIMTIRSDTLDEAQARHVFEQIDFEHYALWPMPLARIPEVIRDPATRVRLRVESDLVDQATEDAKTGDALPLLSFTLERLWRAHGGSGTLTLDHYRQAEGRTTDGTRISPIENSVRLAAEDALQGLSEEQEQLLGDAFVPALVNLTDDMEPLRRRALDRALPTAARPLLQGLVEARLLTTESTGGEKTLEVSHEALLRRWPFLVQRIEAAKPDLSLLQNVERSAEIWRRQGEQDVDLVLKGERLERAFQLLERSGDWGVRLSRKERFLNACKEHEEETKEIIRAQDERNCVQKQRLFAATVDQLRRNSCVDGAMRVALAGEIDPESIKYHLAQDPLRHARLAQAAHESRFVRLMQRHPAAIPCIAFSPDGSRIATGGQDGIARILDAMNGAVIRPLKGHASGKWINGIAFSPDGKRLITGCQDGTVRVWDPNNGDEEACLRTLPSVPSSGQQNEVRCVTISPNGTRISAGCADGSICIWDLSSLKIYRHFFAHGDAVLGLSFDQDGSKLASCSRDKSIKMWRVGKGRTRWLESPVREVWHRPNANGGDPIYEIAFSPDGQNVASAGYDRTARIFAAHNGAPVRILTGHNQEVRSVAYSPDGTRIATASFDWTVRIWHAETGRELLRLGGHEGAVQCVAFSPNGHMLASGGFDRAARIWETCASSEIVRVRGFRNDVTAIAISPDGRRIAAGGPKEGVRILSAQTGGLIKDLTEIIPASHRLEYDRTGQRLLSANADGSVVVVSDGDGRILTRLSGSSQTPAVAALSPDGATIAIIGPDSIVELRSLSVEEEIKSFPLLGNDVCDCAFSPNGQSLATVSRDGFVRIARVTDVASANPVEFISGLKHPRDCSLRLAFDASGTRLTIAGARTGVDALAAVHEVQIWQLDPPKQLGKFAGHSDCIFSIAYTADAQRLATACRDRHVRIFDAPTGVVTCDYSLPQHVKAVVINAQGSFIVAGGAAGMLRIFDCIFAASLCASHLVNVVARHRISGAELLTSDEVALISQFADSPGKDGWPDLSRRIVELNVDANPDSFGQTFPEQMFNTWRRHRELAFNLETTALKSQGEF